MRKGQSGQQKAERHGKAALEDGAFMIRGAQMDSQMDRETSFRTRFRTIKSKIRTQNLGHLVLLTESGFLLEV